MTCLDSIVEIDFSIRKGYATPRKGMVVPLRQPEG